MSVKIIPLFQACCANRQKKPKQGPDPVGWVRAAMTDPFKTLSFHFFVNWTQDPPKISGPLWCTNLAFASSLDDLINASDEEVLEAFKKSHAFTDLTNLNKLGDKLKLQVEAMLLGETSQGCFTCKTPSWKVSLTNCSGGNLMIERLSICELSDIIKQNRGSQANMGSKGLLYGTSAVECYLSKTPNIFPGDCDCLILQNDEPTAILEIKKHTLKEPICKYLADKFYPTPDRRKYDALFALQDKLNVVVPVVIVYYATEFDKFRVQVIERGQNNLKTKYDTGDLDRAGRSEKELGEDIFNVITAVKNKTSL